MLYREIEEKIKDFFQTEKKSALMITGARQVGKTYCIREFAKENFPYVIEINFLEMPSAVTLFECFRQQRHFASYIGVNRCSNGKRKDLDIF